MISGNLCLLVDPVEARLLPGLDLAFLEPEGNFLLGVLDAIATVADVAADVLNVDISTGRMGYWDSRECLTRAKSPRMVPGAEARGLVAPRMERPVLTASRPSQTMAQTGPDPISILCYQFDCVDLEEMVGLEGMVVQAIRPGKKGLSDRSA